MLRFTPTLAAGIALAGCLIDPAPTNGQSSTMHPGLVQRGFIYEEAPFPECHASTIEQSSSGELVAAWFGGTREKHPDVGIWVSRHENGHWTPPVEVANGVQDDGSRHPTWNPVLFQYPNGPLVLFFKPFQTR